MLNRDDVVIPEEHLQDTQRLPSIRVDLPQVDVACGAIGRRALLNGLNVLPPRVPDHSTGPSVTHKRAQHGSPVSKTRGNRGIELKVILDKRT